MSRERRGGGRSLVGRDNELGQLVEAFLAAGRGELRSVVLQGAEGAGTRALLAGLRAELRTRGLAHRWAATRSHPGDAAYAPLAGLLATGRRTDGGLGSRAPSRLDRFGPGTGSSGAAAGPAGDRPAADGSADARPAARPAEAPAARTPAVQRPPVGLESLLTDLVVVPVESRPAVVGDRLARALDPTPDLPLVLAIEGVDQLDPLASAAVTTTLRALRHTRTLAVATTETATDWLADVTLAIAPLSLVDAEALAGALAPGDPERVDLLVELSGRLPGSMVSLSRWPDPRIPATERLAAVHPRAAALTLAAGLAAGQLAVADLTAAGEAPAGLLPELAALGVLRQQDSPGVRWAASRPWLDAALAALGGRESERVATAVADSLRRADAPARTRAVALAAAGEREAAAQAWTLAADEAGTDADTRAACLIRALELSPRPEVALVRVTADALLAIGRAGTAHEHLGRAVAALPRGAAAQRARLLAREYRALLQLGRYADAGRALGDAAGLLPDPEPGTDAELARAIAEVATLRSTASTLDDPAAARQLAEVACDAARSTDDAAALAGAQGALALARGVAGDSIGSLTMFDEALASAEQAGDRALEARIAANRIFVLWRSGQLAAMESSIADELARLADSGLAEAAGGQLLAGRAVVLHALGRWGALTDHLERTLADPQRLGAQVELLLRLQAVELAADLGRIADARAGLAALAGHPGAHDPEVAYELTAVRLGVETLGGDLARAELDALVADAAALARRLGADPFAAARVRVAILRLLGWSSDRPNGPVGAAPWDRGEPGRSPDDPPSAIHRATPPYAEESAHPVPAELEALLAEERAWRTGRGWAPVITAWGALPMPYRVAWAQLSAAGVAASDGGHEVALALIDEAARAADRLSAQPLRAAAERLSRQLGRRGSRSEGALTARERDVVEQVALGRTNREIARALGMSDRTVAVHLTRIFAKLDAGTRGEVAHIARRRGLIGT